MMPNQSDEEDEDPVLGRCLVFQGRLTWVWGMLAISLVGAACLALLTYAGATGFEASPTYTHWILSIWPVYPLVALVGLCGLPRMLWDALGPRYRELRVGEHGLAIKIDDIRTDVLWSSVAEVIIVRTFWGNQYLRIRLRGGKHGGGSGSGEESIDIRTDLMSLSAPRIFEIIEDWRGQKPSE